METNILKTIFFDENRHWDRFVEKYGKRIRIKVLPQRCKGRFCTSCATGETEEWSRLLQEDVFQVNHRHVIFTIDEGLREIFIEHRHLLKPLMDEAAAIVKQYFEKKHKVTPGIIAGLHTFGARINFNPHVHMLVTMGGMKKNGE